MSSESTAQFAGATARAQTTIHAASRLFRPEKMFGKGRCVPLNSKGKLRILRKAETFLQPTKKGEHYGPLTPKYIEVLRVLLWKFHNAITGRCFPSYEAIMAETTIRSRQTVADALFALEAVGLMKWVNRIRRIEEEVKEWGVDLLGRALKRIRVVRTSNQYQFIDPDPPPDCSESNKLTGTTNQDSFLSMPRVLDPAIELHASLLRLGKAVKARQAPA